MSQKVENPYLTSKQLWNDLYGAVETKLVRANLIIIVMCILLSISMMSLVLMALRSRVQPYVAVLHGNELLTLTKFDTPQLVTLKPKLAALMSREFVKKLRGVTIDPDVNQDNFIQALSMTSGAATGVVKDYHRHKPQNITNLQITSLILQTSHVIDIRWLETSRDPKTGDKLDSWHFSAELTFRFDVTSTNSLIAKHNPLGFYITNVAWSKDNAL